MALKGQASIITGGASGIGYQAALQMAAKGADLIIADFNIEGAEKVAKEISAQGVKAFAFKVDVSKADDVEKIKTIGDAYMAAGGMPIPSADSARGTVLAALEMQDFMRTYKADREALGKPAFEMRVGIHTGPVVAGIVGVKKFQYDIWGDTVNTASRMESSGEVGQVNISEATYELVKDAKKVNGEWSIANGGSTHSPTPIHHSLHSDAPAFTFTPRGKVQAKGKGELEMYFVDRHTAKPS